MSHFTEISPAEFTCQPFSLIGRDLMLITAKKPDGTVNTMTAGWGALGTMWGFPCVFTVIRPQRYTREFVEAAEHFSLCFFDSSFKQVFGYLGSVSGRDENKIEKAGLTLSRRDGIPYFEEAQTAIFATKLFAQEMTEESFIRTDVAEEWYPEKDFHILYIGRADTILTRQSK